MTTLQTLRYLVFGVLCALAPALLQAQPAPRTRAQALQALTQPAPPTRLAGVQRLGEIGTMPDADRLVAMLRDDDAKVRLYASVSMWQIWSRSGDRAVDVMYQRGIDQMEAGDLPEAVATFSAIIRRKPAFAEAWNKRATLFYMMGLMEQSLQDCDQVIKRNRNHFGALSGYGQIYLDQGDLARAATYFERALAINPNLPGAATLLLQIRERLQAQRDKTV
ncbi:MAG: tetratricopeptide repeat protein [Rhodoferax sp.]|jgi:tetratricopeptide (TPR) repeat protein|nr:tetratricopeptide repeat protein [Rhodoferax sp.]